jgi:hypothetical protein
LDNLFNPVLGVLGAQGRFDRIARPTSAALWLTTHRVPMMLALAGLASAAFAARRKPG